MKNNLFVLLSMNLLLLGAASAEPRLTGVSDTEFMAGTNISGAYVHAFVLQPDDKIVIGGSFGKVGTLWRSGIARLMANGTPDAGFNTGNGPNGEVLSVARQPDGKILIGGVFTAVNGLAYSRFARLNADGSVDATFKIGSGPNGEVRAISVLEDGKILLAGNFNSYNRTNRNCLARVNPDGSLDEGFKAGTGPSGGYLFTLAVQPDGRIIAAGEFTSFSGQVRGSIVRLLEDGSLDSTFNPGKGVDGWIGCARLQPDGKVVVAGDFNSFAGTPRVRICRLNEDGTLDTTFDPGTGVTGSGFALIHNLGFDRDGSILIGGLFSTVNGVARPNLARLEADGSLDRSFTPAINAPVRMLAITSLGRLVIGGEFTTVNGGASSRIGRLGKAADSSFLPAGFSNAQRDAAGYYLTFRNTGTTGVLVQSSTNLLNWQNAAYVPAGGAARLSDPSAGKAPCRFYRAPAQ